MLVKLLLNFSNKSYREIKVWTYWEKTFKEFPVVDLKAKMINTKRLVIYREPKATARDQRCLGFRAKIRTIAFHQWTIKWTLTRREELSVRCSVEHLEIRDRDLEAGKDQELWTVAFLMLHRVEMHKLLWIWIAPILRLKSIRTVCQPKGNQNLTLEFDISFNKMQYKTEKIVRKSSLWVALLARITADNSKWEFIKQVQLLVRILK